MQAAGVSEINDVTAAGKSNRVVVAIPTLGRGEIVAPVIRHLSTQTRLPDLVIIAGTKPEDFGGLQEEETPFPMKLVLTPRGLCPQRNYAVDMLGPNNIVLFLDDDYILAPDYLQRLEEIFAADPDIAMTTGKVLADGIIGPGFSYEQGLTALKTGLKLPIKTTIQATRNGYGCNMAVRMKTVSEHNLRFDEHLPDYAWFEDVDFSIRLSKFGKVVKAEALRGVHLGTKTHRTPGKKMGYSQVANLIYIARKGVLTFPQALMAIGQNLAANLVRSVFPVAYADHRGRLVGNIKAFGDLIRGKLDPERIKRL